MHRFNRKFNLPLGRLGSLQTKPQKPMKNLLKALASCAVLGAVVSANAQTVTVDPATLTLGYMNWSPVAGDAAGYGGSGSSAWGISDLQASFSGNTLTLSPNVNVYAPGVGYWVNADGSGANVMDANIYNESTGTYVNTTVTFTFDVSANTLVSPYTSQAFIKDFAPDYSSYTSSTISLTGGVETISLLTSANAGDHIQYGFETFGPDANPATAAALGNVIIGPVTATPEPSTLAMLGLGALGVMRFRRGRKA
jgi:hypothetical protein